VNLPNWITVGRMALTPLVAWLPFIHSATLRGLAFVLFLVLAISDHYDGKLARERNEITNLGRLLDPLADKIFLLAVFIPMYLLQAPRGEWLVRLLPRAAEGSSYAFITWGGLSVPFPWWVLVIILGREVAMTWFRQAANAKGVVIAAIGPGKAKAIFQFIWVGAAYFWFAFRTYVEEHGFVHFALDQVAFFAGTVGTLSMAVAILLTVWSFAVYLRRYGKVLR
jgi:CDP-diacylglycerol--glycerol-3-phosphate 3-phosphatidyltransferase